MTYRIQNFRPYILNKWQTLAMILVLSCFSLSAQDFKWYPGHYILLSNDYGNAEMDTRLEEFKDITVLRGFQRRYFWEDMEISKDQYDFSKIIADLNYVHSKGKLLVVQIQFKTFNNNHRPYPAYLLTSEYDGGIYEAAGKGWNLKLWNEGVLDRFKALLSALGAATDSHPALALVNIAESAAGSPADQELLSNWSGLRNAFMNGLSGCGITMRSAFPNTPTISYFNSNPSDALLFEDVAVSTGHGTGGPDVYIGAYEKELHLRHAYDYTQRVAGKVPVGYGVQWNNFIWVGASSAHADPRGFVPPVEHYVFARDVLKANFLCWARRVPYWSDVKILLNSLSYLEDPAGGLPSACPTLLPLECSPPEGIIEPASGELLIYDFNRPVTKADNGLAGTERIARPADNINAHFPGSNGNWLESFNFSEGELNIRALVRFQPMVQNMSVRFCFWQDDGQGNPYGIRACTPLKPLTGRANELLTWSVPVSSLEPGNGGSIDWTRPRERYGIVICNEEGEPLSGLDGLNWQGENPDYWYPLDSRFTVVATAKSKTFSGWDSYIWEQYTPPLDSMAERGLSAYWSFNNLDNAKITDLSPNGNDLSLSGSANLQAGRSGQGLFLPGTSPSYAFIHDADLNNSFPSSSMGLPVDSFSIAAWIKLNTINDRSPVLTKEIQNKRGFEFGVKNGYLAVQIFKDETVGSRIENIGTLLETGRWYHIAMTYHYVGDTSSVIRLYLDGELDEELGNVVGPLKKNDAALRVGHYIWGTSFQRFFNGIIDELYVYNTVLEPEQIKSLMNPDGITGMIRDQAEAEIRFRVFPNPVGDMFTLEFELVRRENVSLRVYDMQGKMVSLLADQSMEPGRHIMQFDSGSLSPQIYFCMLTMGNQVEVLKIVK
jgi:hypothetical protein